MSPAAIKLSGYLTSAVSVLLLGAAAWDGASDHPPLLACLVGGMATSIGGMALRWRSYRLEQRSKD